MNKEMKAFYFLDDDNLDHLPADAQLVPFDINYIDPLISPIVDRQKPKTGPSKKLPAVLTEAVTAELGRNNPDASNPPVAVPRPGAEIKRLKMR